MGSLERNNYSCLIIPAWHIVINRISSLQADLVIPPNEADTIQEHSLAYYIDVTLTLLLFLLFLSSPSFRSTVLLKATC